jgi:hypothetical protein
MIQAVNGMVIEQKQVVNGFIMMMIMFALQMIGLYWIMMDSISAIINTIITLMGMYVWYSYCLRIYNRFYWDQSTGDKWQGFSADDEGGAADLDELSTLTEEDPAVAIDIATGLATGTTSNRTISSSSSSSNGNSMGKALLKPLLSSEDSYNNTKKESKVKRGPTFGSEFKSISYIQYIQINIHTYTHIYIHTYCIYIHTYIHAYAHTYKHA